MMKLERLPQDFSVCQLENVENVDLSRPYVFFAKTDDEISLVCETARMPENTPATEHGWNAFKIDGTLDFGMIGVISKIAGILAENRISVFVVSTFNTDYILVKKEHAGTAASALKEQGYTII